MKRKFFIIILSLVCVFACALGLAACGDNETANPGDTHKHSYFAQTVQPDCEHGGYTEYSCSCGYSYKENITQPLGHDFSTEFTTDREPNCTDKGVKSKHCSRCMAKSEETVIDELGHDFAIEFTTDKEPNCTEKGVKSKHCSRCTAKSEETVIDELGHDFATEFTTDKEPNCTEKGVKSKHCSRCTAKSEETMIDEFGHDWSEFEYSETEHWRTCLRSFCGVEERENHADDNECNVCYCVKTGTSGLTYELNDDNNSYTVTGIGTATDKNLVIPSFYNSKPVTKIAAEAFENCDITSATVPVGITSIGRSAFATATLTTLYFNADSCSINDAAKSKQCRVKDDFDLGITVYIGANVKILPEYFYQCVAPSDFSYGSLTVYVPRIEQLIFAENSRLSTIEHWAIEEFGQNILKSVFIPENVKSIGYSGTGAFYGCGGLESITVASGNTYFYSAGNCLITSDGNLVLGCKNSKIPSDGSIKTLDSDAFLYCSDLKSVDIPNGVKNIKSWTFNGCTSLESVTIPDSVINIGDSAFAHCSSLKIVKLGKGVESLSANTFYDCNSLECITVDESNPNYASQDGILYNKAKTEFIHIPKVIKGAIFIPNGITSIGQYAFKDCSELTSITIPNSVTMIGENAFLGCTSLEEIKYIGDMAGWCGISGIENLMSYGKSNRKLYINGIEPTGKVDIPDGITSISAYTFYNCSALTGVTIPNSVISIGYNAFYGCSSLEEIKYGGDIAGWCGISRIENLMSYGKSNRKLYINDIEPTGTIVIPDSVTSVPAYAFYNCTKLTGITISDSVTSIGSSAFGGCPIETATIPAIACRDIKNPALKSVVISSGDSIDCFVFENCGELVSVVISDSVTNIDDSAFYNCTSLKSITVDENNPNYASQNGILYNKAKTEFIHIPKALNGAITIPDSVTTIMERMFEHRTELTGITIPNSITNIGYNAFFGCSGLTSITIKNGVTSIDDCAFEGCTKLTSIIIPSSVTNIGFHVFYNCDCLTIYCEAENKPNGWNSSWNDGNCPVVWDCTNNDKDSSGYVYAVIDGIRYSLKEGVATVIRQQSNLVTANIPASVTYKDVTYNVTSIGQSAFNNCTGLTSLTIPNSVTSIGRMAFEDCALLTSIVIPDSVKRIDDYAFEDCTGLISLIIGNSVGYIGSYAFAGCTGLTCITIPVSLTEIGNSAFARCTGLTSIMIPASLTEIGDRAFISCTGLTSITVANGNKKYHGNGNCLIETASKTLILGCKNSVIPTDDSVTSIGFGAFFNCAELMSITIPNSVTEIENSAFHGCTGLTSIVIPNGVTTISVGVFENCSNLTSITIPDSVTAIFEAFDGCNKLQYNEYDNAYYLGNETNKYLALMKDKDNSITSCKIHEKTKVICSSAFYNCTSLEGITVDENNPNFASQDGILYNKDKTEFVCIPQAIQGAITIPSSITEIAERRFDSRGLTSITIPTSVTTIGTSAFFNCSALTNIIFNGTMAQWKAITKSYGWNLYTGDFTVTCIDGKLDKNDNEITENTL